MTRNHLTLLCAGVLVVFAISSGKVLAADSKEAQYLSDLRHHYEQFWGPSASVIRWKTGAAATLPTGFGVAVFPPRPGRDYWVYATLGMSAGLDRPIELHLFSPRQENALAGLLTSVAYRHRTESPLELHDTVDLGQPWLEGAAASFGLLSLPYLDGPQLEWLPSDPRVHVLWLVPITAAEKDFKDSHGTEALEKLFIEHRVDHLDPGRESLIPSSDGTRP